jgi:hypothetical protein
VVAHEMLHHALNGPPTGPKEDPHVKALLTFLGCGLLELQNGPPPPVLPPTYQTGRDSAAIATPYYRYRVDNPLTATVRSPQWSDR